MTALDSRTAATPTTSWWREASGSVADLGVLVPIAIALIVSNGLSTTAVLLPAGLLYLVVAWTYRAPVAVQPLKAFGAAAIAAGAGADVIAAGSLIMGVVFLALGASGLLDRLGAAFPRVVIRGVQLAVGLHVREDRLGDGDRTPRAPSPQHWPVASTAAGLPGDHRRPAAVAAGERPDRRGARPGHRRRDHLGHPAR